MFLTRNFRYNFFKFSPYCFALGVTLVWMHFSSDFSRAGDVVRQYHVLWHAAFSVLALALAGGGFGVVAGWLAATRENNYSAALAQIPAVRNLANWRQCLHETGYSLLFLMLTSLVFILFCVGTRLFAISVYTDTHWFNFLILLESFFTVLALTQYCRATRIEDQLPPRGAAG